VKGVPLSGQNGSQESAEQAGQAELVLQKGGLERVVRKTFQLFQ
jgi:hypothetical protein